MYYKSLLTSIGVFIISCLQAQDVSHSCGFDHWRHQIHQQNPDQLREMDDRYAEWLERAREYAQHRDDEVYQIPVVFHIVHNIPDQNLADSVVYSQLEVLNEDYRRQNANAIETRAEFLPVAADVGIEFVLAEHDPQGNPTDGIVRVETDRENFEMDLFSEENTLDEVKFSATGGSDAWDTESYLNIWVCNISGGFLGQIFGLAYPPADVPNWPEEMAAPSAGAEGVIIHFTTLGRNNPAHMLDDVEGNDQGRTLVHEVGHYLGLRHIWGDATPFVGDGCAEDDGFADTPNCVAADNFQCNHQANTCVDEPEDFVDMVENYMDYSPDLCMNMFTQEQADMMRFVLTEFRPGLLNSDAVGVDEYAVNEQIEVFPNPANEQITVRFTDRIDRVELLDLTGRSIGEFSSVNANHLEIPVQQHTPGTYFLRVHAGDRVEVHQWVRY